VSRPALFCLHGWGFDARFFDALASALPEYALQRGDFGFFDAEPCQTPKGPKPFLLVGHSLGFLALLGAEGAERAAGLVSLGGFPRFVDGESFPLGVPSALLTRMRRRFQRDPAATLREFYTLCDAPKDCVFPEFDLVNAARLTAGLESLASLDQRARLASLLDQGVPVLALSADDDRVTPAALQRAAFADARISRASCRQGGHLFPLTQTAWVADALRGVLERARV
jgi:pimeloyl-[acyl-carrier protein] methyl ester esterase